MIAPTQQPIVLTKDVPLPETRPASLPGYWRLVSVAFWACSPLLAIFLIGGKLWLALSVGIGLAFSVVVCGILHLFVARGMDYLSGNVRSAAGKSSSMVLFAVLLPVKFVIIGALGWVLLTLHSINYAAVLAGFGLAQAAIAFTAAKHFNKKR